MKKNVYPLPVQFLNRPSPVALQTVKERSRAFIRPALDITPIFACKIPVWKRTMDIIGSLFGLVLLFPLIIIHFLYLRIMSPGPIFFKQERVGKLGKKFMFYKFRTMDANVNNSQHCQYLKELIKGNNELGCDRPMKKLDLDDDPRIIRGAHFIRKLCIDELPQFINVLRGEMSLVGPRPCIPYEAEEYLRWHKKRFYTTPGMTGLWQVSGKNNLTFKEMIRLDIKYENEFSLWLDMKIFFKTIPAIIIQLNDSRAERRNNEKTT